MSCGGDICWAELKDSMSAIFVSLLVADSESLIQQSVG